MASHQALGVLARRAQDVERQPLRALAADAGQTLELVDELLQGFGSTRVYESRQVQPRHHAAHAALHLVVHLAVRVVDRGDDQVLQHADVVLRHDLGVERQLQQVLVAVDHHRDHAAAGGGLDADVGHLLLQALLHLLRLLHHRLDIHDLTPQFT